MANATQIGDVLDNAIKSGRPTVKVVLDQLSFIDAVGLRALALAAHNARLADVELVLINPSPAVRVVFRAVRFRDVVHVRTRRTRRGHGADEVAS